MKDEYRILIELSRPEAIRRLQILRAERLAGTRSTGGDVAARFGVSPATAKRDLCALRRLREKLVARGVH